MTPIRLRRAVAYGVVYLPIGPVGHPLPRLLVDDAFAAQWIADGKAETYTPEPGEVLPEVPYVEPEPEPEPEPAS